MYYKSFMKYFLKVLLIFPYKAFPFLLENFEELSLFSDNCTQMALGIKICKGSL